MGSLFSFDLLVHRYGIQAWVSHIKLTNRTFSCDCKLNMCTSFKIFVRIGDIAINLTRFSGKKFKIMVRYELVIVFEFELMSIQFL